MEGVSQRQRGHGRLERLAAAALGFTASLRWRLEEPLRRSKQYIINHLTGQGDLLHIGCVILWPLQPRMKPHCMHACIVPKKSSKKGGDSRS